MSSWRNAWIAWSLGWGSIDHWSGAGKSVSDVTAPYLRRPLLLEAVLADQHRRLARFLHSERLDLRHRLFDRGVGIDHEARRMVGVGLRMPGRLRLLAFGQRPGGPDEPAP